MLWVPDKIGCFRERPKYSDEELEAICDSAISAVQIQRHGECDRPVTEGDLTVLVEGLGADLDLYADFSSEPGWVQGVTDFGLVPPLVQIRQSLAQDDRYIHRLKSTLAHEAGHLLTLKEAYSRQENVLEAESFRLRWHGKVSTNSKHDWSEYQADYCIGALLMRSRLLEQSLGPIPEQGSKSRPSADSNQGQCLINQVSAEFRVSIDAARVRLVRLGYLHRTGKQLKLPGCQRFSATAYQFPRPPELDFEIGPLIDSNQERWLINPVSKEFAEQLNLPFC